MATENVAGDDAGLLGFADVRNASGQDGIAIVGAAVLCEEADETLLRYFRFSWFLWDLAREVRELTLNEAIFEWRE